MIFPMCWALIPEDECDVFGGVAESCFVIRSMGRSVNGNKEK